MRVRARLLHAATGPWPAVLLGVLAFLNSLANDFVYDDRYIVLSPRVRDWTDWRGIWLTDWWKPAEAGESEHSRRDRLYRPLAIFTFALNYAVHGYRPVGYHAVNVALHAVVCWLVWRFAVRLTLDPPLAAIAAVLFAVHPVHAEAVANIVGRAEVLSAMFLLLGLLALMPPGGRPGIGRALVAGAAFLLALLSKETAVCYPALALVVLVHQLGLGEPAQQASQAGLCPPAPPQGGRPLPRAGWWFAHGLILATTLAIYLPLRYYASDQHLIRRAPLDVISNPLFAAGLVERIAGAFTTAGHYVRLVLAPSRLSCDYGIAVIDPRHGVTPMTLLGAAALAAAVAALIPWRRRDPERRLVAVLAALGVVSYVLVSNTFLLIGVAVAERLMYWPSVPALLLLALLALGFWRRAVRRGSPLASRPGLVGALGVAVVGALFLRTVVRNMDWRSNMALFTRDVETFPQSAHLHQGCALELLHVYRDPALAAREHPNTWPAAQRHLSNLARRGGPHGGALPEGVGGTLEMPGAALLRASEWHVDRALAIFPGFLDALALRARIRAELGRFDDAERDLQAVLAVAPVNAAVREVQKLIRLARERGAPDRLAELREAVAGHPNLVEPRLALARELIELGRYDEAEPELQAALRLEPDNVVALHRLADTHLLRDRPDAGRELLRRVVALDPNRWEAHANLTVLLAPADPGAALLHAQRAYALRPEEPRNAINLAEALALNRQKAEAIRLLEQTVRRVASNSPLRPILEQRLEALRAR